MKLQRGHGSLELTEGSTSEVSKSQRKREMLALQQMGARLMSLKPSQWLELGLSSSVMQALDESLRIKGQGARRRHERRLGKLLREAQPDAVERALSRMDGSHDEEVRRLHRIESWRDRLLTDPGSAMQALQEICPDIDRQQVEQLVRVALSEGQSNRARVARRKLFGLLSDVLTE
ncbi:MAG: DUF615 domain-containing protein [Gammaproteobacteria bacterium]|nr:DUF615 domain-containing protein [Gammaproteobacteria bacterium]